MRIYLQSPLISRLVLAVSLAVTFGYARLSYGLAPGGAAIIKSCKIAEHTHKFDFCNISVEKTKKKRPKRRASVAKSSTVTVQRIKWWKASGPHDERLLEISASAGEIALMLPQGGQPGLTVDLLGTASYGVRLELYNSSVYIARVERKKEFSLFGDNDNPSFPDLNSGAIPSGRYSLRVGLCQSASDTKCSHSILFRRDWINIVQSQPQPSPTPIVVPTEVPPPSFTPMIRVLSEDGTLREAHSITGPAPLHVAVASVYDFQADEDYVRCFSQVNKVSIPNVDLYKVGCPAIGPGTREVGMVPTSACATSSDATLRAQLATARAELLDRGQQMYSCQSGISARIAQRNQVYTNSARATEADFLWNFGDITPQSLYNQVKGFNASHLYTVPGSYTLSLTVVDENGLEATKTVTVSVLAPEPRSVIFVSSSGNDAHDGSTPERAVRSTARVNNLLAGRSSVDILFRAGDTFEFGYIGIGAGAQVDPFSSYQRIEVAGARVRISRYGTGPNPVLRWNNVAGDARLQGNSAKAMIHFKSSSVAGTVEDLGFTTRLSSVLDGNIYSKTGFPRAVFFEGTLGVALRLTFHDIGDATFAGKNSIGTSIFDSHAVNLDSLREYLFFAYKARMVFFAGNSAQNSIHENVLRVIGASSLINIHDNLIRSTKYPTPAIDSGKACFVFQSAQFIYFSGNRCLESTSSIGPLAQGDGQIGELTLHAVLDGNRFNLDRDITRELGARTALQVNSGAHDVRVSNNSIYLGDQQQDGELGILVRGRDEDYQREARQVLVAHNSVVAGRGASGKVGLRWFAGVRGLSLVNNLVSFPSGDIVHQYGNAHDSASAQTSIGGYPGSGMPSGATYSAIGCNLFSPPEFYRGQTFNAEIHPVALVDGAPEDAVSVAEWQRLFAARRSSFGPDRFLYIPLLSVATMDELQDFPPAPSQWNWLRCPKVRGVNFDINGIRRSELQAEAGAHVVN